MKKIGLVLMVFMPVFWGCQEEEVAAGYEIPEVKKVADFRTGRYIGVLRSVI